MLTATLAKAISNARIIGAAALVVGLSGGVSAQEKPENKSQYNNVLYKSSIDASAGPEVLIREAFFPPKWKAPRHYHNGNLFIYIIEGEFEVELEGSPMVVYKAGDALQMRAGVEMEARNPSDTNSLKMSVFQVGKPDAPFVVPVAPKQ